MKFRIITSDTTLKKQWPDKLRTRYDASKGGNDLAAWQMAITDFDLVYKDMPNRDNVTFIKDMDYFSCTKHVFCDFSQKSARKCKIFCIFTVENM